MAPPYSRLLHIPVLCSKGWQSCRIQYIQCAPETQMVPSRVPERREGRRFHHDLWLSGRHEPIRDIAGCSNGDRHSQSDTGEIARHEVEIYVRGNEKRSCDQTAVG